MANDIVHIQVMYAAGPTSIWTASLTLPMGACVSDAIEASGVLSQFPALHEAPLQAGIYGQACTLSRMLADGDRVELYRPLNFDPMESRRRRALHKQNRLSRT
ncbi:RnfH family protein [Pusillimonas sp. TS35]|nr:RnfH family protein [Pusillimonas sp. TS35]